jgi:peptide/nickel transport system permease protein
MLTRLLFGARTSIGIAVLITLISFSIGIIGGIAAATGGYVIDQLLNRIVDVIMAIPPLICALLMLTVLGSSIPTLVGLIAIVDATRVFRLARASAMDIVALDFVEVARLRGEKLWWVLRREILPNALPPLSAEFGLRFCYAFLFVAALSFLGLGIQPPTADWGGMVKENAAAINYGILAPLVPASAIAMITIGINLVVDWLLSNVD